MENDWSIFGVGFRVLKESNYVFYCMSRDVLLMYRLDTGCCIIRNCSR